ncbi:MAG: HD domain-containing protein [Gemmataceae bacterium]|nr:HD domain-containing protein [Gemmataceae bacterium]
MNGFTPALLDAVAMAAIAHNGQLRKDGRTPYVSHVIRVCLIARQLFQVGDEKTLIAAVLHDVIEDTTIDFDDIEAKFGKVVAEWVAALSKDKRLPEDHREAVYIEKLRSSPCPVQLIKLADILDNHLDSLRMPSSQRETVVRRTTAYLDALADSPFDEVKRAYRLVRKLLEESSRESEAVVGGE